MASSGGMAPGFDFAQPFVLLRTPPTVKIPILAASVTVLCDDGSRDVHVMPPVGDQALLVLGIWPRDNIPSDTFDALITDPQRRERVRTLVGISHSSDDLGWRTTSPGVQLVRMMLWTSRQHAAECNPEHPMHAQATAGMEWARVTAEDLQPEFTWARSGRYVTLFSGPVPTEWEAVPEPDNLHSLLAEPAQQQRDIR
jgi:hypothetical protein